MKRDDAGTLDKILERLQYLDPPIKRFLVEPPDPAMAIYFIDLAEVRYITTRTDQGRDEIMFVMGAGKQFFSNLTLGKVETRLKEHPHFMRTSKFYIVNLARIRGMKVSNARDLWFDGINEPLVNAVTSTYLTEFEKRMK